MNKTTITARQLLLRKEWERRIPTFGSKKIKKWMTQAALPIFVIFAWQLVGMSGTVSKTVLPTPIDIVQAAYQLTISGELFTHLKVSLFRAVAGFLLGAGIGLLAGIAVGFSTKTEDVIDPTIQMLRTIPHLAVAPLFILWFGFGEASKILLIAKGAFFPVYVNTFLGIRGVDAKLFDVARILHFSRWKKITLLIIPSALPAILSGIRLSLGAAWLGLVVAELMGSTEGIGYMMMDARQFSNTDIVFVGIILFAVVGKLTDSFVRVLEKRLLRWQDTYKGTM
jgi:sulfonate transport system permease protein